MQKPGQVGVAAIIAQSEANLAASLGRPPFILDALRVSKVGGEHKPEWERGVDQRITYTLIQVNINKLCLNLASFVNMNLPCVCLLAPSNCNGQNRQKRASFGPVPRDRARAPPEHTLV